MKAGIVNGVRNISVEEVPDPKIQKPGDAVVKVARSCVCGSDLWFYRGVNPPEAGNRIGHEFIGTVEEVGENVKNIKPGDFVISAFYACDGTCPACRVGQSFACENRQMYGGQEQDGGQGQKVRVPMADGTLTVVPKAQAGEENWAKLLPLTDVLCTGHHAAVCAGVVEDKTVAVVGDGAVGLCGVAASKRLGAKRIFLISTHEDRAKLGKKFGATDIINVRGDEAVKQIKDATEQKGVDCVLECVGMKPSWDTAFGAVKSGGNIGFVGVPADPELEGAIKLGDLFGTSVGIKGGGAPAADYAPELLPDVLSGKLDASAIFTKTVNLDDLAEGYAAMDKREAVKVMVLPQ
jgi:threonine dehydrogenase-like Zn-dependent dehydrogenase